MDPVRLLRLVLAGVGAQTLSSAPSHKGTMGQLLAFSLRRRRTAYLHTPVYPLGSRYVARLLMEVDAPTLRLFWMVE